MKIKTVAGIGLMTVGIGMITKGIMMHSYDKGFIEGATRMADDIKTEVKSWAEGYKTVETKED